MKSILFVILLAFLGVSCNAKKEEVTAVSCSLNTGDRIRHFFVTSNDLDVSKALGSDSVFKKWVNSYNTYQVSRPALEYFAKYLNEHQVESGKPMLPNYIVRVFGAKGRISIFKIDGNEEIGEYLLGLKHWMEKSTYKLEYNDILNDIEGVIQLYEKK